MLCFVVVVFCLALECGVSLHVALAAVRGGALLMQNWIHERAVYVALHAMLYAGRLARMTASARQVEGWRIKATPSADGGEGGNGGGGVGRRKKGSSQHIILLVVLFLCAQEDTTRYIIILIYLLFIYIYSSKYKENARSELIRYIYAIYSIYGCKPLLAPLFFFRLPITSA